MGEVYMGKVVDRWQILGGQQRAGRGRAWVDANRSSLTSQIRLDP